MSDKPVPHATGPTGKPAAPGPAAIQDKKQCLKCKAKK